MSIQRDESLDTIKYILIVCVIFGHCLGNYYDSSTICRGIYNFINLFHMPLFIFLSGFFSKKYDLKNKEQRNKFILNELKLLETFIIFCCVHQLIRLKHIYFTQMIIDASWSMWYLLSLFWWRLILQLIPKAYQNPHKQYHPAFS